MCNSIKFETSWSLPPVLKTVQKAGRSLGTRLLKTVQKAGRSLGTRVLKTVQKAGRSLGTRLLKTASTAHAVVAKHVTGYSILVRINDFDLTTGFYWSRTLLLKPPILMHPCFCSKQQKKKAIGGNETTCYLVKSKLYCLLSVALKRQENCMF